MSEIYDEGLLPPHVEPSPADPSAQDDGEEGTADRSQQAPGATETDAGSPPPEADTDDQLPGTDDGLHGQVGATDAGDVRASDPFGVPDPGRAPDPERVPDRDPDIAPPTEPERLPGPGEDPEVAPLIDPEFDPAPERDPDTRDPQRPEGTPV